MGEIPRVYTSFDTSGYAIDGQLSARLGSFVLRSGFSDVRRQAIAACGMEVTDRSWLVFLSFPGAPAASIGFSVALFARTRDGWRLCFRCQPNLPPPNCGFED